MRQSNNIAIMVFLALGLLFLAACSQRPELSSREQRAVDRLTRDTWVDVIRVERNASGGITAVTRQGEEVISYHITFDENGSPQYERLPRVTFGNR